MTRSAFGRPAAGLGESLYTDYLLTVELAGALLFVALIGALAIAAGLLALAKFGI